MNIIETKHISYVFDIPKKCQWDLIIMSPLEWQVDKDIIEKLKEKPLEKITIDVRVVIAKTKKEEL